MSNGSDDKLSRYCLPMTDYERPILAAEEKFFNECNTENGEFIVISIVLILI